jgi:hypothetical protein
MDSLRHVLPPPALSALSRPEPEALLVELFGKVAALTQTIAELREEIARLKGLKGRPNIKPSGMDKGTEPPKPAKNGSAASLRLANHGGYHRFVAGGARRIADGFDRSPGRCGQTPRTTWQGKV